MLIVDMPIGTDLVDRAVLYERLKQWHDAAYDTVTLAFLHEVKMLIGSAPHVKAVELVRCGECRHRGFHRVFNCRGDVMTDFPENSKCPMQAGLLIMPDDFYCKYGERKDGVRNENH